MKEKITLGYILYCVVQPILIGLKVGGFIKYNWLQVLTPLWIVISAHALLFILMALKIKKEVNNGKSA